MELADIKSHGKVIEIFEDLFHRYSNLTDLPKFKKRKVQRQEGNSKNSSDLSSSSLFTGTHQSRKVPFTLREDHDEPADSLSFHPHAKDQGSFSSGVFSIDSDIDNLVDDDEVADGEDDDRCPMESSILHEGHEQNALSLSEAPSEARSGVVESPLWEDTEQESKSLNQGIVQGGTGILTDEDVLFMMHKPRLKKRRKKPPWQKRKLDIDDLWVKGQHLQCHHDSCEAEEVTHKLYLERNLRWGKISLQNYICAVRKSREGKKTLNSTKQRKSGSKKKSFKDSSPGDQSFETLASLTRLETKNGTPASAPQTFCKSSGKKGLVKSGKKTSKRAKKSGRWFEDPPLSTSEASDQDVKQRSKPIRAVSKKQCSSDTSGCSKRGTGKITSKSQKVGTKVKESKADTSNSREKVRLQKNKVSRKSNIARGERDSSSSKNNSFWNDHDSFSDAAITQNDDRVHHYGLSQETSGSQESGINFISLTPRKSRKLSRRKRRAEEKRKINPSSTSDSSDFGGHFGGGSLHPRGSLRMSNFPGWDDEEEVGYQPLFGQGSHCGGVWNTIIEESS
ncbi:uncharacterized protein LOC121407079 [Lytechinus variegatus]|uniref:uncharacterized protein LOC121407079 n=1 Tax=Lytechinus variegatus TaxID=7654 RepID=UPI001BB169A5|nr:uncharacterized protein LOC121407079 [Lytechinus variegatus]